MNILGFRYQVGALCLLMEKAGEGGAPPPGNPPPPPPTPDPKDTLIADLQKRLDALEGKKGSPPPPTPDPLDLGEKARKDREEKEKVASNTKQLEKAIAFTMSSKDFLKTNESLLPKTISGIFEQAEKENYGTALEKASAIKVGLVQEFFAVQNNLDLLTESQKVALEDFRKLTKNDKQERVQGIYESIFEPTFESLKRIEKAKQLAKGHGASTDSESAYLNKMRDISKKYYLKKKGS